MIHMKPHLEELFRTTPSDFERKDYLRLDMNENVDGLPYSFVHSVSAKINPDLLSAYPDSRNLIMKIANHNQVNPDNISLSPGSCAAIKYFFDAFISPDDSVIFTDPTFAMYPVYCQMFNTQTTVVPYNSSMSFPLTSFIECIKQNDGLRLAIVVNPHNPTGTVISQDSMEFLLEECLKKNAFLIVDEAYFYYYPKTVAGLCNKYKNLVVIRTFSKLCGLAALRIGYVLADNSVIQALNKVKPSFDINGLALLFAGELLDRPDIMEESKKLIESGKNYLYEKLDEAKVEYVRSYANFILIKCRENCAETVQKLKERKILVAGGFRQDFLRDFIRVTVGSNVVMERFWNNFLKCLTQ